MNSRNPLQQTFGLTLVVLLLAGCSRSPTEPPAMATPTPGLPTATATPEPIACTLQCDVVRVVFGTEQNATTYSITGMVISGGEEIEIDGLQVGMTCELGGASQSGDRSTQGGGDAITVSIDEERTYTDTQRTYRIVGGVTYDPSSLDITDYDLTVTGGVFGETPQTCRKP